MSNEETPIYDNMNVDKPTPILGPITSNVPVEKNWVEKVLNPTFRRWAYGVTAALLVAGATWAGKPEFIPVAIPLVMAIFYVDNSGEPKK